MSHELDRRTYDILRLIDQHEPIGSIQLVELMQRHGYEIKDRTIRLKLSELDQLGFTEKVPGQGRRLTVNGQDELEKGDIDTRLEKVRARIATLTSSVSYDPISDSGTLVASTAYLDHSDLTEALGLVEQFQSLPLGPVRVSLTENTETEPGDVQLAAASSITLDGVLLSHGINARILNAGIVEYEPTDGETSQHGGTIHRHVDVISGEGSSVDIVSLLIESGRTNISEIIENRNIGPVVCDNREFPVDCFEKTQDLAMSTRNALGGAVKLNKPREQPQIPNGTSSWSFGSITYIGPGELLLTLLNEYGLAIEWDTFSGTIERSELSPIDTIQAEIR